MRCAAMRGGSSGSAHNSVSVCCSSEFFGHGWVLILWQSIPILCVLTVWSILIEKHIYQVFRSNSVLVQWGDWTKFPVFISIVPVTGTGSRFNTGICKPTVKPWNRCMEVLYRYQMVRCGKIFGEPLPRQPRTDTAQGLTSTQCTSEYLYGYQVLVPDTCFTK